MRAGLPLILALFFTTLPAFADQGTQVDLDWLQISAFAARQTSYSGVFIYQYGNHVAAARITHISDQNGEHEKLESLDGPRREFIRNNNDAWWTFGDHKIVRMEKQYRGKSFPSLLPEQLSALNENYVIRAAEQARIAGFDTQAIIFLPKDTLRYIHKFWIHMDSGLLLKAAVFDERKQMVEQYTFTQLKIGSGIERAQVSPGQSAVLPEPRLQSPVFSESGAQAATGDWKVATLPLGFKKIREIRRPLHDNKAAAIHFVFSDGLAGISVFIETLGSSHNKRVGLSSRGAINVYSKLKGDYLVTVVGEVPPRTVMQVVDSVRYKGQ